ncbi:MAG: non-hydrolyzing UDP-N-acetylglucosamine 2-epimerase [Crocinitomicaceae bacterium]|jgi:UDP-N-acetylglucosamine 2-epimerase (non-hydrolysing)
MLKILHVVGARPNFMKLAPVYHALSAYSSIEQNILHSGQHHDINMSDIFFEQLDIPMPDFNLEISGGTSLNQLSKGIISMEKLLIEIVFDLVCVYGDVNATAFGAITASKLGIKVAHIEAGLRSFDKNMPEETNRILTDAISDYFFTPSQDATENLIREGHNIEKIFMVGNVMIDSLIKNIDKNKKNINNFNISSKYALVTLHRPVNVDDILNLRKIMWQLIKVSKDIHLVFPVHPRTNKLLKELNEKFDNISFLEPLDYFSFINLEKNATFVLTDSGGVQEETTFLKVPCFTLRSTTERPITLTVGSNTLIKEYDEIYPIIHHFLIKNNIKKYETPTFWDGRSGERIAKIIYTILNN